MKICRSGLRCFCLRMAGGKKNADAKKKKYFLKLGFHAEEVRASESKKWLSLIRIYQCHREESACGRRGDLKT
jgi:hypothetical protein